jgi:hypothetical protein
VVVRLEGIDVVVRFVKVKGDEVVVVDEGIEVEVSDVDSVLLVKTIAVVDVCVVEVDMSDVVDEVDA